MTPFTPFSPSSTAGPFTIISILSASPQRCLTYYEVTYNCCGTIRTISHSDILRSIGKGVVRCVACRTRDQRNKPMPRTTNLPTLNGQPDATGWIWPSLSWEGTRTTLTADRTTFY
jgi:hypothetical protein